MWTLLFGAGKIVNKSRRQERNKEVLEILQQLPVPYIQVKSGSQVRSHL
jgi:hypothetical protein